MAHTPFQPLEILPAGYGEVRYILLTENKLLLWLNLLALVPLVLMLIWMAVWWALVGSLVSRGGVVVDLPWWLALIAILLIVLPLHEFLHGVTITLYRASRALRRETLERCALRDRRKRAVPAQRISGGSTCAAAGDYAAGDGADAVRRRRDWPTT